MNKLLMTVLLSLALTSCTRHHVQQGEEDLPANLESAVDASSRAPDNQERDEYQHPLETLTFFGITPQTSVMEIDPGAGYYAEILAPFLVRRGRYVMAISRLPSRPHPLMIRDERKLQEIFLRNKVVQLKASFVPFEPLNRRSKQLAGSMDAVLVFDHLDNWVAKNKVRASFKFCHDVLRDRGVLGIVQHRIAEGKKRIPKSGYMTEREVINMAQQAGFRLLGKSEINANPKDTADYPKGVWTLPPLYRLGEHERDKYEAIGESDHMTLKFEKTSRFRR